MAHFTFRQADWKETLLFSVVPLILSSVFKNYMGELMALGLASALSVFLFILLRSYLYAEVTFSDTYFLFKKGLLRRPVKVNYTQIDRAAFNYNRNLDFHIYTEDRRMALPPPPTLEKAEALFQWLGTNHPAIKLEIIKYKP